MLCTELKGQQLLTLTHGSLAVPFQLTFRIFVLSGDIFSVVAVNTFGADISPHRRLVDLDL